MGIIWSAEKWNLGNNLTSRKTGFGRIEMIIIIGHETVLETMNNTMHIEE